MSTVEKGLCSPLPNTVGSGRRGFCVTYRHFLRPNIFLLSGFYPPRPSSAATEPLERKPLDVLF